MSSPQQQPPNTGNMAVPTTNGSGNNFKRQHAYESFSEQPPQFPTQESILQEHMYAMTLNGGLTGDSNGISTSTNGSGFQNFNMTNRSDTNKPNRSDTNKQQDIFSDAIWTPQWNKPRPSFVPPRDTTNKLQTAPSGSGALAASSEAEPSYQSWSNQTRNASGNTSPNRPRMDAASTDLPNSLSYYSSHSAIGQRAPGRDTTQNSFNTFQRSEDSETGTFPTRRTHAGDPSQNDFRGPRQSSRESHISQIPNRPSQIIGLRPASHSDNDLHSAGNNFSGQQYTYSGNNSQRESFSEQSSQFPTHESMLRYGMTLNGGLTGDSNGISTFHGQFPSAHTAQLNPGSQPWENTAYGQGHVNDSYINNVSDRRGSGIDRVSPAGGAFRSPRSSSGTPQPLPDHWGSRPGSRDHRTPLDSERRPLGHNVFSPQAPSYSPAPYYQQIPGVYNNLPPSLQHQKVPYSTYVPQMARSPRDYDPGAHRSLLLETFKNSQKSNREHRNWELKDIRDHAVEFAGDQHGSRFIQKELESANSDEKDLIFQEICPNVIALQKDVFGNYVIQKLYEHGSQIQKKILADKMKGQVVSLSLQMYACRVVQKALEHILVEQKAELVKELESDIIKVMKDVNGNHVVQKVIEVVPRQYIGFIMDCFKGQVGELALHTYACRVIQRALEYGNEDDKRTILSEIHSHTPTLVMDQFGNYVSQHVIEQGMPEDRSKIIAHVTTQLLTLSKHKFASNVVEKCIQYGTPGEQRRIAEQLIGRGDGDNAALQSMMKDQYANYVVQKLLKTIQGPELHALRDSVKLQVIALKKSNANVGGKHILTLETLVNEIGPSSPGSPAPVSPGLQGNGGSAVPTPNLTNEPNSPSSNPPSTNASSLGDIEHQTDEKLTAVHSNGTVTVTVRDDEL